MAEWLEHVAWRNRSPEFENLRTLDGNVAFRRQPVMDLYVAYGNTDGLEQWARLLPHPNILDVVDWDRSHVAVRYAAIDWRRRVTNSPHSLANWGIQLLDAFAHVRNEVPDQLQGFFTCPRFDIDIGGQIRLGFLPVRFDDVAHRVAPELERTWPRCAETAFVFAVGKVLQQLSNVDDPTIETVLRRATEPKRTRRISTLLELRGSLGLISSKYPVRTGNELRAWRFYEEGVGWLQLDHTREALEWFDKALAEVEHFTLAEEAREAAAKRLGVDPEDKPKSFEKSVLESVLVDWKTFPAIQRRDSVARRVYEEMPGLDEDPREMMGKAVGYEIGRAFREALAIYDKMPGYRPALTPRARCHFALGEYGLAVDYAQRALTANAADAEALTILTSAMLGKRWFEEALRNADALIALTNSGRAHYLRGRALFALARLPDAHAAFEQATRLDPMLIEAQLLRREVERVTGNVRLSAGSQHAPTFDIPEQLAELRDVLISGDSNAAITALRDDRYARDADAQLLLARFLAFDRRLDEAIAVYDALEATSHRTAALVGKATALLDLGRAGDALSIFEQMPDDADAAEGAARALETLGRLDEAAEAYRRFIALASSGSDLRVRAAQLSLDELSRRSTS